MNYKDIPYTSIATGILFILSEILPFIPKTGNGFLHTIVELIRNKGKLPVENKDKDDSENEEELECINTSERIIELKKKLNEINNEINEEMKKDLDALSTKTDDISSETSETEIKKIYDAV
jgi:hypothetical protein